MKASFDVRIHGAQQMILADVFRLLRDGHRVQPAQHAELRFGFAQAVEHHGADHGGGVETAIGRAHHTRHCAIEPKFTPQRAQCVDIAHGLGVNKLHLRQCRRCAPEGTLQAGDQRIEILRPQLVEAPKVGDKPLAGLAVVITVRLYQLQVGATTRSGYARKHAHTVHAKSLAFKSIVNLNV